MMKKSWPILILAFVLFGVVGMSCYTNPLNQAQQSSTGNGSPLTAITNSQPNQSGENRKTPESPPYWRRLFVWPGGVETLAVCATLFFIAWQALLTRQALVLSESSSQMELRAYLAVVIGPAIYQERRTAEKGGDLMFECRPVLVNSGRTPAKKVRLKARAAIMPVPLPKETHLPEGFDDGLGETVVGPQQSPNMFSAVEGFCQDSEVDSIKNGSGGKGLYTWGLITYEDTFGEPHFTRFCHHVYWTPAGEVRGFYVPGRNEST